MAYVKIWYLETVREFKQFISMFAFSSHELPVLEDTQEHLELKQNDVYDCTMDLDYETNLDNLEQELFDVSESS